MGRRGPYPDLVGQRHVDHGAEGVADVRQGLVDGPPHGRQEQLVLAVEAPVGGDCDALGGVAAARAPLEPLEPLPLRDARELRALFQERLFVL